MSLSKRLLAPTAMVLAGATLLSLGLAGPASHALAQGKGKDGGRMHDVTISIDRVRATTKIDALSQPDFYARVTINGVRVATTPVPNKADISPNWVVTNPVPAGVADVKVEILDKDIQQDDPIDINRVVNKRDLDFKVNTRSCRISGFNPEYRCGAKITRAGDDARKAAEITFTVTVKK